MLFRSKDQLVGARRQMFLTEQGYKYEVLYKNDLAAYDPQHSHAQW